MVSWAFIACVALRVSGCAGSDFLLTSPVQQRAFLQGLEGVLGRAARRATEQRLGPIADALQPTFKALPKDSTGALSPAAARYALHRLLVGRHGWHVKGLAPEGQLWSSPAPALGLGRLLPERLSSLVDEQLGLNGFDFDEVVLVAATVETFARLDVEQKLKVLYWNLGHDAKDSLDMLSAIHLAELGVQLHLKAIPLARYHTVDLPGLHANFLANYEGWSRLHNLIRGTFEELTPNWSALKLSDIAKVLEKVFQDLGHAIGSGDCQDMEKQLLQIEDGNGTGRVKMRDFYKAHVDGEAPSFQERIEYLRMFGVVDETDPSDVHLLIPNYLHLQSNCVNATSLYAICCIDACQNLLGALEAKVQAPHATPSAILSILSEMSPPSLPGNRSWSRALVGKLEEVAGNHGGQVPFHGRLFSQWMHFAYPRTCAYPRPSSTARTSTSRIASRTNDMWLRETGLNFTLTPEEMRTYIEAAPSAAGPRACDDKEPGTCWTSMWVPVEELMDPDNGHVSMYVKVSALPWRLICLVVAVLAAAASTLQQVLAPLKSAAPTKPVGKGVVV